MICHVESCGRTEMGQLKSVETLKPCKISGKTDALISQDQDFQISRSLTLAKLLASTIELKSDILWEMITP